MLSDVGLWRLELRASLLMRRDEDARAVGRRHEARIVIVRMLAAPSVGLTLRLLYALAPIDQLLPLKGLLVLFRLHNVGVKLLGRQLVVLVNPDCLVLVLLRRSAARLAEAGTLGGRRCPFARLVGKGHHCLIDFL